LETKDRARREALNAQVLNALDKYAGETA